MEHIHTKPSPNGIIIRQTGVQETALLQAIGRQTFFETFSATNTEENMSKYLAEGFAAEKLNAELNDPGSAFYFALCDDQVIGYLKLNFGNAQTDLKDSNALEIERIYVLQDFHGKQVGQLLYEKAVETAQQADADYIWLGVWEENPRAIRFYEKNGFVAFDKHIFVLGDDKQTDILMKRQLKADPS
ncbi:MAG: GNAT family N-acetyltransferase [Chitinophagaceae bacterium]|nr:GNAT family N-acetyltransferase [Chitinophagaceae bacterium]